MDWAGFFAGVILTTVVFSVAITFIVKQKEFYKKNCELYIDLLKNFNQNLIKNQNE